MKNSLYILCIAIAVISCKKEKQENDPITISGRIVGDCSMTPLANSPMKLLISESQAFTGSDVSIYDFTSDANGNFSYTVNNPPVTFISELRFGGTTIKGVVPKFTNSKNLGELIAGPTTNFIVKLKVNNPYAVGDTLFIKDFSTMTNVKISAPLSDYTFNTTYNYSSLQNRTLTNKSSVEINSNYSIYNGVLGTSSYNKLHSEFYERLIPACSGMIDTVLIEIN